MDIELYENMDTEDLMKKLNTFLHEDCRAIKVKKMPEKHEAIEMEARWASYCATLAKKCLKKNEIEDIIKSVLESESILTERTNKKGLKKQVDIRKSIASLAVVGDENNFKIEFVLKATNSNSANEEIPILRADDFINLIFPNTDWNILRLELMDECKRVLL